MLLITGITGHSGTYFLKELINGGSETINLRFEGIRVITRSTSNTELIDSCGLDIERYVGNLNDEGFLFRAFKGVDTLFHIAGIAYSSTLVRVAAASGVKRMFLVHTTGIYSKYKAASEGYRNIENGIYEITKKNNIVLTILRPTMIYGSINDRNIIMFIKMIDRLKIVPVVNHAKYELQPVHAGDLGKAYAQVLMHSNQTGGKDYTLSGKDPITLIDIFKVIQQNLGQKRVYFNVPYHIAYSGAWFVYIVTFSKKDFREKVQRLCESRIFSHHEASMDFGYAPVAFEEGVVSEISEWKNRGKKNPCEIHSLQ